MSPVKKSLSILNINNESETLTSFKANDPHTLVEEYAFFNIAEKDKYDSSYYGDPYAYDWNNSDFETSGWGERWTG